jgi:myosin protein heavy chain
MQYLCASCSTYILNALQLDQAKRAKAAIDKTKASLESENVDMANEIKQLSVGKQESERKRKQLEQQVNELTIRLAETDRAKGDAGDKATRMQVCTQT